MRRLIWWFPLVAVLLMPVSASAPAAGAETLAPQVLTQIAKARMANLEAAKADGYVIITPMIPQHGLPLPQSEDSGL